MATMGISSTGYEPVAWRLAREGIGQSLRQRYAAAKELPPSSSTPFSKLDVLKVCCADVGNASDAGETPKGVRALRIKSEAGFHSSFFDPQTLVLIEKVFDEAWLTLKSFGNKTVKAGRVGARCIGTGNGRRARSRPIARRSTGATAARDRLARGELIAQQQCRDQQLSLRREG